MSSVEPIPLGGRGGEEFKVNSGKGCLEPENASDYARKTEIDGIAQES